MREAPPLGVRPRPEVWDRAIQQPVVVGLVERDEVLNRVDEVPEQWELLRRRRAAVGTATSVGEGTRIKFVFFVLDERVRFGARPAAISVELCIQPQHGEHECFSVARRAARMSQTTASHGSPENVERLEKDLIIARE